MGVNRSSSRYLRKSPLRGPTKFKQHTLKRDERSRVDTTFVSEYEIRVLEAVEAEARPYRTVPFVKQNIC